MSHAIDLDAVRWRLGSPVEIVERISDLIRGYSFRFANENELQAGIFDALVANHLSPQRELVRGGDRYDLAIEVTESDLIVIETKIAGSAAALLRQLHRYACSGVVLGLIAVVSRQHLAPQVGELNGKPLRTVVLTCL